MSKEFINCTGIVCFKDDEVLLIKRGNPPRKGEWSIPGGKIEFGESEIDAALRELSEETGIKASIEKKINQVEVNFEGFNYILHNYKAVWVSGKPIPGSDALDAKFIKLNKLKNYKLWKKTQETINAGYNDKQLPQSN